MKSKKSLKQIRESRKKLACELFMQHVTNRDSRNNRLRTGNTKLLTSLLPSTIPLFPWLSMAQRRNNLKKKKKKHFT